MWPLGEADERPRVDRRTRQQKYVDGEQVMPSGLAQRTGRPTAKRLKTLKWQSRRRIDEVAGRYGEEVVREEDGA